MENVKSILLVEDDPFLIDIYTTKFKEAGFSVETADSGENVLEKVKEKKFDLVILDIVLPQLDGWEVIGRIKSDPESKDLKVIILSNLGQKEEVEKGMKLGAEKYLIKAHYTPSQVVEEIKEIIR
jgi:DNA-binding response OmpR family regulator